MFALLLLLPTFLSCILTSVQAADVNYVFNLSNDAVAPDGFSRAGVLVNGAFPGTLVQANKDSTLHITVNNALVNPTMRRSTSIHWHGLFQARTASEDGPAMVNQCPISPAHNYTTCSIITY